MTGIQPTTAAGAELLKELAEHTVYAEAAAPAILAIEAEAMAAERERLRDLLVDHMPYAEGEALVTCEDRTCRMPDVGPDEGEPYLAHLLELLAEGQTARPRLVSIASGVTASSSSLDRRPMLPPTAGQLATFPPGSVLQDWVMRLPLREQGTLLTVVRGCDLEPKEWTAEGVVDTAGRRLTAWTRWAFMNPADPREVDVPGSFFQRRPPSPFRASAFGHLPLHWYTHAMHALEVIAYRHPDLNVADDAGVMYHAMAKGLHVTPETREQMFARLSEDRIASGEIVS
jgi:hypothetical protein